MGNRPTNWSKEEGAQSPRSVLKVVKEEDLVEELEEEEVKEEVEEVEEEDPEEEVDSDLESTARSKPKSQELEDPCTSGV
ncbi:hypothetical protein Tco_1101632 [Tanacetum coccineum]